ncbi:MAG: hypothetical protein R3F59_01955 [Myxococcota bacterium]
MKCVDAPPEPATIARLYRLSGISRYVAQDLVASVADFEVARGIEPDTPIDDTLGKPLRLTYDAVPPDSGERLDLPAPTDGDLRVDGVPGETAPADRGYFVQWLEDDAVRGTWLVSEGGHPGYPTRGDFELPDDPGGPKAHHPKPLLVTGLATGALAAGGVVGAALLRSSFLDSDAPSSQLRGQIAANRALGYGGIGLGVVSLGLVGTSIAVEF